MQALDAGGQLIKVYARDDAGSAADWQAVLGGPVPGCLPADKETQNCKVFKLSNDTQSKPFSKLFQEAWERLDKKKIPPEVTDKLFQDWLNKYNPSGQLFWRNKDLGKVGRESVSDLKKEIKGIRQLRSYIGRTVQNKTGNFSILDQDWAALESSWSKYYTDKIKSFSPDRLIHYIAFGHESKLLRTEAEDQLKGKYRRYGLLEGSEKDPLKTNANVEKVLAHLKVVMTEQKVKIV